jgi:uncharacterized phage protein gp47/JayE
MPLIDGEYQKLTKEEIQEQLEDSLEDKLDATAQAGDLVSKQLEAEAETLAQNQEEALSRVHRAAYLRDATGQELDKVVDIIGLTRNDANGSTGTIKLWRDTPPTSDYIVPSGAGVQTSGPNPTQFVTTEQDALTFIGGFEDGSLNNWENETSKFSVVSTAALIGDHALELPAETEASIRSAEDSFGVGTTFTGEVLPEVGSITGFRFGIQDQDNYIECEIDEAAQDLNLRVVEDGSEVSLSNNDTATIPTGTRTYFEIEWGLYDDTTVTLYESKDRDVELCSVSISDDQPWTEGPVAIVSLDNAATQLLDQLTTRAVIVNIRAEGVGPETNVGPNRIETISNTITGVEEITNPVATGKPTLDDTDRTPLLIGEDRETDEQLRQRAFDSTSIGGSATVNALNTELRRIDGVQAMTLNRNRKETKQNGLPPHSFEAIVYGGSDEEVARTIFNTASIDSHDVGGINGVGTTYDITSNVTKETETVSFSRPNRLDLNITLDLVVDENYVGETDIRSIIANFIGGTDIQGNFVTGLDVAEEVYLAVLKRKIVNPEQTGVWEVNTVEIDKNGDGTDDTETTASGAEVLAVDDNEVAITNARDGSISITTTQK